MKHLILCQEIYIYDLPTHIPALLEVAESSEWRSNNYNLTSVSSSVLEDPRLSGLKTSVEKALDDIVSDRSYRFRLVVTESWMNKTLTGCWHHGHIHPNSLVSGVMYINESDSSTWFGFKSIWPRADEHLPYYGNWINEEADGVVHKEKTKPGRLVLFPSRIYHSVDNHTLEAPRYTLSFNTFAEGDFGTATSKLSIKVVTQ